MEIDIKIRPSKTRRLRAALPPVLRGVLRPVRATLLAVPRLVRSTPSDTDSDGAARAAAGRTTATSAPAGGVDVDRFS